MSLPTLISKACILEIGSVWMKFLAEVVLSVNLTVLWISERRLCSFWLLIWESGVYSAKLGVLSAGVRLVS